MKWKKVVGFTMAVTLAVTGLAGCSGSQESDTEKQNSDSSKLEEVKFPLEETMEFTSFSTMNMEYTLDDNLAMQTAMENANIDIQFDSVLSADLVEKRNLVLASGEYPDMFFKSGLAQTDLNEYGSQGIFIPLEDYIKEYAPNLTAKLDEMDGWQYITSPDGHIYSLPELGVQQGAYSSLWINKKWLDNLGLEEPKSFDELYEVLKAFKEQDANGNGDPNDEIPLTGNDVCPPELLLQYADYAYDLSTKTAVIDGELTYIPTSDKFKEYIEFVSKLYQEGILDKNVFTQKYEQQGAIGQSGDVLGAFFDAGSFLTVGRDNDDDYMILTPFQEGTFPLSTAVTPGAMAITDACENPEVLVAWADQFYSEEGGILAIMGVEGKTYKVNDSGEWEWIVGEGYGDDVSTVRASNTIQGGVNHPSIWPNAWYENMSANVDPEEVYLNSEKFRVAENGIVPLPQLNFSDDDAKTIATIKTDVDTYIQQYVAQVATGETTLDESWNTYIETMDAMGAQELTDIYQNAYKEAMSSK